MYNVLVVDDTDINLIMIKQLLSGFPVTVDTATGGSEALEHLDKKDYDFCLFDYQMPEMSGVELLTALRGLDNDNKSVPVVAMTGTEDENAVDYFVELGFNDFLNKPVKKDELLMKLLEILDDPVFDEGGYEVTEEELKKIPQGLLKVDDIDVKTGMKSAGSAEDYVSAVRIFYKAIDKTADEIEAAFNSGDMKNYTIKVHGLKSTARMIGAYKLSDMAAKLEEESKTSGDKDLTKDTADLLETYRELHNKLLPAMQEDHKDGVDRKRIDDAYATLKDYAATEDYDLIELVIGAMERYEMPEEDEDRFRRMKSYLLEFNFDEIKKVLEEVG